MSHLELLTQVRQTVQQAFEDLGMHSAEISETILIRGGNYCGRRFQTTQGHAIWFIEENQIKIYLPDGGVMRLDPSHRIATRARAA